MKRNDTDGWQGDFPVTESYIYLDHAGVAPMSGPAAEAMVTFVRESAERGAFHYGKWSEEVERTRALCSELLGADKSEIAFIRSTSHGLSLVARGIPWKRGDNVVVYEKEFPANLFPWMDLRESGVEIRFIPEQSEQEMAAAVESHMDQRTRLVSLSSVQFMSGYRCDLGRIGSVCRDRNVLFCVDAIQSLGVIPMDVADLRIDFLAADGHKWLMGPEGIGIFYCRKEVTEGIHPALVGWKSVKNPMNFEDPQFDLRNDALRFEEGSQNIAGILGLGAAIAMLQRAGIERIQETVQYLGERIIGAADVRGFRVITPRERTLRGGAISFTGPFDAGAVRDGLRRRGIMVNARGGGLRISPHFYNHENEIQQLFEAIDELLAAGGQSRKEV